MLFNTIDFGLFLPIVFALYWFALKNRTYLQNVLIVVSSYIFYGWWDYRFLSLIFFSTLVDYQLGVSLSRTNSPRVRKYLVWTSAIVNLGLLGYFKYYNFFIDSLVTSFSLFGLHINARTLDIILPVGISFYTFQTLSYTIDVYRKKLEPTHDFIAFAAYVSFFPQLVAGPIERATHLLPQFTKKREFNYNNAADGLKQILWGLFKKVVIADNCAEYANIIFNNSDNFTGSTLALGAILFAFQIYGDFSGYSDIAIGTARLFGFDLMQNFNFPYFSRDIAEFWRKWHISLSTWFRDYLYIPLGGSKGSSLNKIRNILIIFIVSGLWHGANWTFIAWGLLNAIYFMPLLITNSNRKNLDVAAIDNVLPNFKEVLKIIGTFCLTTTAWIFFRATSINQAITYISNLYVGLASKSGYVETINFLYWEIGYAIPVIILLFIFVEWIGRNSQFALANFAERWPTVMRFTFYYFLVVLIFWFGDKDQSFIYFQF